MVSDGIYNRAQEMAAIFIRNELNIIFTEEAIPRMKEIIMESYRDSLNGVVHGPYEQLKPDNLESSFADTLNGFEYISTKGYNTTLRCPEVGDLGLAEAGLSIIGAIVEGIPSDYYKVSGEDYARYVTGSTSNVSEHLIAEDNPVLSNFDIDRLDKFEFSCTSPANIMEAASSFVKENFPSWMRRAIQKATLNMQEFLSGANRV